jgi:hypothetical protein
MNLTVVLSAIVALFVAFSSGTLVGVKYQAGKEARKQLQQQQQAARERHQQREFADGRALEHAQNVDALATQLLNAYATIAELEEARPRACLDPRTVRVLNATGNVPARAAAGKPADPPAAPAAAGNDAAGTGLRWASNIDVGRYIAYCRAEYGKIAAQLNRVLDIEDKRFGPVVPRPP